MKTLQEYCNLLGWNVSELARQSGIDYNTAKKAFDGKAVRSRAAQAIAEAISEAIGEKIFPGQIGGLVIR